MFRSQLTGIRSSGMSTALSFAAMINVDRFTRPRPTIGDEDPQIDATSLARSALDQQRPL